MLGAQVTRYWWAAVTRLTRSAGPIAQPIRRNIKWLIHRPDDYNSIEVLAKRNNVDVLVFDGVPTLWDTRLLPWSSYLLHISAMRLYRARAGGKVPGPMIEAEASVVADICVVLPTQVVETVATVLKDKIKTLVDEAS